MQLLAPDSYLKQTTSSLWGTDWVTGEPWGAVSFPRLVTRNRSLRLPMWRDLDWLWRLWEPTGKRQQVSQQHSMFIVQHIYSWTYSSTTLNCPQCLLVRKLSLGLYYSKKETQMPHWAHKQISMGSLCSESCPHPTPKRTWHCPPYASGGSTGQKGWLFGSFCCRYTPRLLSFYMLVCFVNSLFLSLPTHPHAVFSISVLNYFTLILTDSKHKHTYSVYHIYYNCPDSLFKPFPLNLSKHGLARRLSRYGHICSPPLYTHQINKHKACDHNKFTEVRYFLFLVPPVLKA